jgi:signal peptidase complex subunit 3
MYSLSGRLNSIAFNTLIVLTILSAANYFTAYINRVDPTNIKFELQNVESFVRDRFINEDALSFTFDLDADLTKVFNWNTNLLFVYITVEFKSKFTDYNKITVWD